jgi:pimeloyl-ACP methyl ester carboxylesterase
MKNELVAISTSDDYLLHGAFFEGKLNHPAFILLHGAQMNFYTGLGAFLPALVAEQGYACLTANFRGHDMATAPDGYCKRASGSVYEYFHECAYDVSALIDFLRDRGYHRLILVGHSQAAFKILYAQSVNKDPDVNGLALISPPPSAADMTIFMVGREKYERGMAEAREAVQKNDGKHLIAFSARGNIPFVFSAQTYLSFCDPEIPVDARILGKNVSLPMLITRGGNDLPPITGELVQTIKRNCARPDLCQVVELEGASHFYENQEPALAQILLDWVRKLG